MGKPASSLKPVLTAASQALAASSALELAYGSGAIAWPELGARHVNLSDSTPVSLRGVADLAALSLRYHDANIHRAYRPHTAMHAAAFDALERVRLEAKVSLSGITHNVSAALAAYGEQQAFLEQSAGAVPPMADILCALLRERIFNVSAQPALAKLVETWRLHVESKAGALLGALSTTIHQKDFAPLAQQLLEALVLTQDPLLSRDEAEAFSEDQNPSESDDKDDTGGHSASDTRSSSVSEPEEAGRAEFSPAGLETSAEPVGSDVHKDALSYAIPNHAGTVSMGEFSYHAYSVAYDEIIPAEKLSTSDELTRLRAQLDSKLAQFPGLAGKLTGKLQRLLLARQSRRWVFDLEDGVLHAGRLGQWIARPDLTTLYKQEAETAFRNTVVTLLIDNSGSMRGRPITVAALSADILARTLERCGVKVEILGFTTRDWKGGEARKRWLANGKPPEPGRLNDLRHIIYKSADMPYRRARKSMGLMLKEGILKENIDGEAIMWAFSRLRERSEERKILMVISDGAPVDDSTLSTNTASYLDAHLRSVITAIEARSDVELLAIGIGHDVTRYYTKAVTIPDVERLADTMTQELTRLFTRA